MNWRDFLADPGLTGFVAVEEGNRRILVKGGYETWARAVSVGGGAEAGRMVEGGRAAHPLVALPEGGWAVVRRYRRGGMMRHVNRDRYFLGHRPFEELRVTECARAAGVRVPEVIAAVELRRGVGYGGLLATRWVEGAVGIDRWLAGHEPGERLNALRRAGEQVGRMHAAGVAHPDLNLRNLLASSDVAGEPPLLHLIDFDRARVEPGPVPPARRTRDLRRLARSARKLGVPFGPAEEGALRQGYGSAWPADLSLG
jgi:3-deoxy-D-manno-octulosonic acid kinase